MELINWGLIREPMNWFIVIAMLIIGTFVLRQLSKLAGGGGMPGIGGNPAAPRVNAPGV
jgi:hypothetical protein